MHPRGVNCTVLDLECGVKHREVQVRRNKLLLLAGGPVVVISYWYTALIDVFCST
jgi:hypothetical protein